MFDETVNNCLVVKWSGLENFELALIISLTNTVGGDIPHCFILHKDKNLKKKHEARSISTAGKTEVNPNSALQYGISSLGLTLKLQSASINSR